MGEIRGVARCRWIFNLGNQTRFPRITIRSNGSRGTERCWNFTSFTSRRLPRNNMFTPPTRLFGKLTAALLLWKLSAPAQFDPNRRFSTVSALSQTEAVSMLNIPEEFQMEPIAGEPDFVPPIACGIDDHSRLCLVESTCYPSPTFVPVNLFPNFPRDYRECMEHNVSPRRSRA